MKHKTSELTGDLLDAAVAKACGFSQWPDGCGWNYEDANGDIIDVPKNWSPSKDWDKAGPVIERERIHLMPVDAGGTFNDVKQDRDGWLARCPEAMTNERGDTPLIAACRAFVAHKLGEEVDL